MQASHVINWNQKLKGRVKWSGTLFRIFQIKNDI